MGKGTFYGIGVGPGDPELLTLKAARVIKECKVLAVPSSDTSSDGLSQAYSIVEKAVDLSGKEILRLSFPMTKDREALKKARAEAAVRIAEKLNAGVDAAFITLGDPMLYSTFSYLVPLIQKEAPGASVKIIPGITSFSAIASRAGVPLAETDERVIIIPAAYEMSDVKKALDSYDTVVLMKVNRIMDKLIDLLTEGGLDGKAVFATRVGWPEETVTTDLKGLKGKKHDYFSTVIIRKGMQDGKRA